MKFWKQNFHWLEPLAVAIFASAASVWVSHSCYAGAIEELIHGNRASIYGALASVFGALLGFVLTAVSIILGLSSLPQLTIVRESRYYPTLYRSFILTTWVLGAACLAAIVGLIFDRDEFPCRFWFYAAATTGLAAIVCVSRSIWLLERIVLIASQVVASPERDRSREE